MRYTLAGYTLPEQCN